MCAGFWWHDVHGAENIDTKWVRHMPSFSYNVVPIARGRRNYQPAIFASWPISRIAVINDPESGTHEEALEIADAADLPVALEEE
jgi:hypothetical protein